MSIYVFSSFGTCLFTFPLRFERQERMGRSEGLSCVWRRLHGSGVGRPNRAVPCKRVVNIFLLLVLFVLCYCGDRNDSDNGCDDEDDGGGDKTEREDKVSYPS